MASRVADFFAIRVLSVFHPWLERLRILLCVLCVFVTLWLIPSVLSVFHPWLPFAYFAWFAVNGFCFHCPIAFSRHTFR